MQMILGKRFCPTKQQCLVQTENIGENLRWQRRETAPEGEACRDYQPAPQVGEGIVRSMDNVESIANIKANLRRHFRLCRREPRAWTEHHGGNNNHAYLFEWRGWA